MSPPFDPIAVVCIASSFTALSRAKTQKLRRQRTSKLLIRQRMMVLTSMIPTCSKMRLVERCQLSSLFVFLFYAISFQISRKSDRMMIVLKVFLFVLVSRQGIGADKYTIRYLVSQQSRTATMPPRTFTHPSRSPRDFRDLVRETWLQILSLQSPLQGLLMVSLAEARLMKMTSLVVASLMNNLALPMKIRPSTLQDKARVHHQPSVVVLRHGLLYNGSMFNAYDVSPKPFTNLVIDSVINC